jgi:hypothetical protein
MVGEIPNKYLSLIPVQKKHGFKFKYALKLVEIKILRALGDQDLSPKNIKYELGKALQKKNPVLVVSGIPGDIGKSDFILVFRDSQSPSVWISTKSTPSSFRIFENIILIKF